MGWIGQLFGAAIAGVSAMDKGSKRRDAENELENMPTPTYRRNQSILDFYDSALRKYNVLPTESAEYKTDKQNINQGVTQGLGALRDRRSALSGIPSLISGQNKSLLNAAVNAERRKRSEAGVVMSAAGQAASENERDYRYNQIGPFEKKYNLLAAKAAGLAKSENASLQSLYNSLGSMGGGMGGMMGGK